MLAGPAQTSGNLNGQGTSQFPMVMQMTSSGGQLFYTYQNADPIINASVHNKANDTSSSNSGIGQVVISPVQNSLNILKNNGNSPTIPAINISSECKPAAARGLGEIFNVQNVPTLQQSVVQNGAPGNVTGLPAHSIAATQNSNSSQSACQSPDLANILSSLQVAGVLVGDQNIDKSGISSIVKSNPIPVGNNISVDDSKVENVYKIVDGTGNIAVFTTGGVEPAQQSLGEQYIQSPSDPQIIDITRLFFYHLLQSDMYLLF